MFHRSFSKTRILAVVLACLTSSAHSNKFKFFGEIDDDMLQPAVNTHAENSDEWFITKVQKEANDVGRSHILYADRFTDLDIDELNHDPENMFRGIVYVKPQTPKQKTFLLGLINQIRRNVGASNMNYVRWSHVAETVAIEMTRRKCGLTTDTKLDEHIEYLIKKYSILEREVFKNPWTKIMKESFKHWIEGSEFYRQGKCLLKKKEACLKYLTVVWYSTEDMGCSYRVCPKTVNPLQDKVKIICLFYPKRNYLEGPAFIYGPACARCNITDLCIRDLCIKSSADRFPEDYVGYTPSKVDEFKRDVDVIINEKTINEY